VRTLSCELNGGGKYQKISNLAGEKGNLFNSKWVRCRFHPSVPGAVRSQQRQVPAGDQYSEAPVMEAQNCGVLDTPMEPVIGLAEGETRWRSMTVFVRTRPALRRPGEGRDP